MSDATGRPRTPGVVYGVLAIVLLVLVGLIALTQRTPPPPTIAEFAPQAVENIVDAPNDQGRSGSAGEPTPTPEPLAAGIEHVKSIDVARVRRCVGDPPRQIEDPQSPPCVPYWAGDNGGATSRGVTRDSVRVVGYFQKQTAPLLEAFFNSRFEFYGRKLTLDTVAGIAGDCTGQKAQSVGFTAAKYFALLDGNDGAAQCLYTEFARTKGVAINAQNLFTESRDLAKYRPYLWQYDLANDRLLQAIGEMICKRLAGHNAIHAADPVLKVSTRKFGIFVQEPEPEGETHTDIKPLNERLAQCGITDVQTVSYANTGEGGGSRYVQDTQNGILQMQSARVTSVVCLCQTLATAFIGPAATGQGYFPEWIISSWGAQDYNFLIKGFWASEHRPQLFGITSRNRQVILPEEPWFQAAREIDQKSRVDELSGMNTQYRAMLLLASGVQMAGPNLTPSTFEAALHKTAFPNPDHRTIPAKVGFLDGDHTMTNDAAEMWWSETELGPDTTEGRADGQPGTLCYVDGGARRKLGAWPSEPDPFFSGECRGMG